MRIPKDPLERYSLYVDVATRCFTSAGIRKGHYEQMRKYYMSGSDTEAFVGYNNVYPHLDLLKSFLYAQDATKLNIELDATDSPMEYDKVPIMVRRLQQEWHDSNVDQTFGQCVLWSLVYGSMILKLNWKNGINVFPIEPDMFGVLREDVPTLSRQQAVCHKYYATKDALLTQLADHPRAQEIISKVTASRQNDVKEEGAVSRIITSAAQPNIIGNVDLSRLQDTGYPTAASTEDLICMGELYVYNDDKNDYTIVTLADFGGGNAIVFERDCEQSFIKNELPFIAVCPNPSINYFFGYSEVLRLAPLQDMLNQRMDQIQHMLNLQARPTSVGYGLLGTSDEIQNSFDIPGSYVASLEQNFKFEQKKPDIPQDLYAEVDRILEFFTQVSGLSNILQGRGERGVRSGGHASELAKLGSSRAKARALVVEDALEQLAGLMLKTLQKRSKDRLIGGNGTPFYMEQFTHDCHVKVDAHSSSPAFADDTKQDAFELFKAGIISGERVLDLVNPPMVDLLKKEFRETQAIKQKQAEAQQAAKLKQQQSEAAQKKS